MAYFKSCKFVSRGGDEYQLDLDLNDEAIMRNHVEFVVAGTVRKGASGRTIHAQFTVRLNVPDNRIEVIHQDQIVGTIYLARPDINQVADVDEPETLQLREHIDNTWERICAFLEEGGRESIERIIDNIPAVDPVFGCLIRAALSTAIGQLLKCYAQDRPIEEDLRHREGEINRRRQAMRVLECLKNNLLAIGSRFAMRFWKCFAFGGIF